MEVVPPATADGSSHLVSVRLEYYDMIINLNKSPYMTKPFKTNTPKQIHNTGKHYLFASFDEEQVSVSLSV